MNGVSGKHESFLRKYSKNYSRRCDPASRLLRRFLPESVSYPNNNITSAAILPILNYRSHPLSKIPQIRINRTFYRDNKLKKSPKTISPIPPRNRDIEIKLRKTREEEVKMSDPFLFLSSLANDSLAWFPEIDTWTWMTGQRFDVSRKQGKIEGKRETWNIYYLWRCTLFSISGYIFFFWYINYYNTNVWIE